MGFRNPLTTASATDTATSPTGAGVRLYQTTISGFPAGILELRDGVSGDAHASLSSVAYLVPQYDGGGQLIGYTSAGRITSLGGGSSNGVSAPRLDLEVTDAAAGGKEGVAALVGAERFTLPRIRLSSTADVSATSTDHAFQIGPDNGLNLAMDNNEAMMRNNGVPAPFILTSPRASTESEDLATAPGNAFTTKGRFAAGLASVSAVANTVVSIAVSFGKTFDSPPIVVASPVSTTPQQITGVGVGSITTTGFTLYVFRTTTTATGINWAALAA